MCHYAVILDSHTSMWRTDLIHYYREVYQTIVVISISERILLNMEFRYARICEN